MYSLEIAYTLPWEISTEAVGMDCFGKIGLKFINCILRVSIFVVLRRNLYSTLLGLESGSPGRDSIIVRGYFVFLHLQNLLFDPDKSENKALNPRQFQKLKICFGMECHISAVT